MVLLLDPPSLPLHPPYKRTRINVCAAHIACPPGLSSRYIQVLRYNKMEHYRWAVLSCVLVCSCVLLRVIVCCCVVVCYRVFLCVLVCCCVLLCVVVPAKGKHGCPPLPAVHRSLRTGARQRPLL